jgi:hypothetical protein
MISRNFKIGANVSKSRETSQSSPNWES